MDRRLDTYLEHCEYTSHVIYPYSWLKVMRNHSLIQWLWWVNRNICDDNLERDSYYTTMVKLRIATGMLNKLTSLTDEEKREIHTNLTTNVNCAMWSRQERDLPF